MIPLVCDSFPLREEFFGTSHTWQSMYHKSVLNLIKTTIVYAHGLNVLYIDTLNDSQHVLGNI